MKTNKIYTRTKISEESALALLNGKHMSKQNMLCTGTTLLLHGNMIAEVASKDGERVLNVFDCGWRTNTTKERINAVLQAFGVNVGVYQRKHVWYIGNNDSETEFTGHAAFKLG